MIFRSEAKISPRDAISPAKSKKVLIASESPILAEEKTTVNKSDSKSTRRRRPASAPSRKQNKNVADLQPAPLGLYSKSLKLVGVDVPSTRTQATKLTNQAVKIETKEPTMRTRLAQRRRSESLADLRQSLTKEGGVNRAEFEALRKSNLREAVFERWYIAKYVEALEARRRSDEAVAAKKHEEEERKKEVEERSKEEFQKWLEDKKKMASKAERLAKVQKGIGDKKTKKPAIDPELIEKKNKEWLEAKSKELVVKRAAEDAARTKLEQESLAKAKKQEDAGKVYQAWKEAKMRELKERVEKEKAALLKKVEDQQEKVRSADIAFAVWKRKKAELRKGDGVKAEKKKEEELIVDENGNNNNNNKVLEARAAYEAWLEGVEARELEELLRAEDERRLAKWKPPWYPPGGKADCFL